LPAFFKKTDQVYRRVQLQLLDDRGQPRTIQKIDPTTGQTITLGPIFHSVENRTTGNVTRDDSHYGVACRCACVFLVTPLYTAGVVLWNAYQWLRATLLLPYNIFQAAKKDFMLGRFFTAASIVHAEYIPYSAVFKERVIEILKAPFLGAGLTLLAFAGIFRPFAGRECIALFEKAWHHGASIKEDISTLPPPGPNDPCLGKCIADLHAGKECFIATCCQSVGNLKEQPGRFREIV
jgi:hypothetical protein